MKLLTCLLVFTATHASTVTVCASGCTYTNFQTALTATASDCAIDVVQLTAGETFSGTFNPPYRDCVGGVWVRSSRYAELPPVGSRVGPSHASLMPTINANVANSAALKFYQRAEDAMTGVDTSTDIITIEAAFATGTPFSCSNTPPPPMVGGSIYYAINVSGTTMQVALAPGGTALDITGAGSTGASYYSKPLCVEVRPRKNWRITGLNITMPAGTQMQNALVRIGAFESNRLSVPSNIWMDRNYIHGHGDLGVDYPGGGIQGMGANLTITDNYISDIWMFSGEGKPLFVSNLFGPALIKNNALMGGSIGFLSGGAGASVPLLITQGISFLNNYVAVPGNQMYRQGAGAPTGSCYYGDGSGMFYRNTSSSGTTCSLSGRCYTCQADNTWAIDTGATYRDDDFLLKNRLELKDCKNCTVEGNIFKGQQASVDSQGNCVLFVAAGSAVSSGLGRPIQDVTFKNNQCLDTWGGISTTSYETALSDYPSYGVAVENNLTTGMGSPKLLNVSGATSDTVWQLRLPKWQNQNYRHNTSVPASDASISAGYGLTLETFATVEPPFALPAYVQDNIWWQARMGVNTAGSTPINICNSLTSGYGVLFFNDGTHQLRNNVQFAGTQYPGPEKGNVDACSTTENLAFAANAAAVDFAADWSLNPTSPYSASCSSGCAFAATDGKDVGVDVLQLNTALNGVQTGAAPMTVTMALGSTHAIAKYTAPDASACTVKLYNNASRQTLNADTDTGGEQTDARTGSVTLGTSRQVVFGVNSVLTASTNYWLTTTCGSTVILTPFRTLAAGAGFDSITTYSAATTGEYSSSATMSSPTSISNSTTHTVPVPAGGVRYYRRTGGPIVALVAP